MGANKKRKSKFGGGKKKEGNEGNRSEGREKRKKKRRKEKKNEFFPVFRRSKLDGPRRKVYPCIASYAWVPKS